MSSNCKKLNGVNSKVNMDAVNGEVISDSEDPYACMNEFRSLYCEKIKAIEENCEDPTEAKIKTLEDWVDDLTKQNITLLNIVEELEREALERVNAMNSLAMEAKESVQQDAFTKEAEDKMNKEFEGKISSLQDAILENNSNLEACMKQIDDLSQKLADKTQQYDQLREQYKRLNGDESDTEVSEDNSTLKLPEGGTRPRNIKNQVKQLQNEVKEKEEQLKKLRAESLQQEEERNSVIQSLKEQLQNAQKELKERHELQDEYARSSKWSEDLKGQVTRLGSEIQEKEELLVRTKRASLNEVSQKDQVIKELQENVEKARCDLEEKTNQYLQEKKQKDAIKQQYNRLKQELMTIKMCNTQSSEKGESLQMKINDLESELRKKNCEIAELNKENCKKAAQISQLDSTIEKLSCKLKTVCAGSTETTELLKKSMCREEAFKKEICNLKNEINNYQNRIECFEETIRNMNEQLDEQHSMNYRDPIRDEEVNEEVCSLLSALKTKDEEIKKHIEQERQLCDRLSRMEYDAKEKDRRLSQMSDKMRKMSCDIQNKYFQLEKQEIDNVQRNLQNTNKVPIKAQSESSMAAAANKALGTTYHHSMETFQECKNYIHAVNELETDFDKTDKAMLNAWNSLKIWSQNTGDQVLKEFGGIVKLCSGDNDILAKLGSQLNNALEGKTDTSNSCTLAYLEGNLIELGRYLTLANMMTSSSDSVLNKDEEDTEQTTLSRKVSSVLSDSLSLLYELKKNGGINESLSTKACLEELMVSFSSIIGNKKTFLEKLVSLQKQQIEFVQCFLDRVSEFDSGLSSYHNTAENLKNEIRKLFSLLLTKENQVQKQCDEIHNLKALLSCNDRFEISKDEINNLRKVVSNKDLQLIEKEELIHNLRSLNYTLRRTKLSRSSPNICSSGDFGENLEDKIQQLEDCVMNIKGNLNIFVKYLGKSQDKMEFFEDESRKLVQVLAKAHQEITSYRETGSLTGGKGDSIEVPPLDIFLNEAASKIEHLLNAVEIFLCDSEKPDLSSVSEELQRKLMKLVYVTEFLKKSALQEHSFIKTVLDENEDFKKKMKVLEDKLLEETNRHSTGEPDDKITENLRESLKKAQVDLEVVQEKYSNLKMQKEDMELKNQKVMQELQTKISTLQESAAQAGSIKELEKREQVLQNQLRRKEKDLEYSKKEVKEVKNLLNLVRSENSKLQFQVNDARHILETRQKILEERKVENENIKMQLEELANLNSLQNIEVDKLHKELLAVTMKYDELKVLQAVVAETNKKLIEELEDLKNERTSLENQIATLEEELRRKEDEIAHKQNTSEKQKENLTKYVEENQLLKMQHEQDDMTRVKLEYELEKLKEELEAVKDRECHAAGELVEKKQAIYQLNLEKSKLERYISDMETFLNEKNENYYMSHEKGDSNKNLIEEQEQMIQFLLNRLNHMSQYIAERDETIKLIESQLKASTEFMKEESEDEISFYGNEQTTVSSRQLLAYKAQLSQLLQQNRRLINMVDKLQQINWTLLHGNLENSRHSTITIHNGAGS